MFPLLLVTTSAWATTLGDDFAKHCAALPGEPISLIAPNRVPRDRWVICVDTLGTGAVQGPSPFNQWDRPLPSTEIVVLVRTTPGQRLSWTVSGERGWEAPTTLNQLAPAALGRTSLGTPDPQGYLAINLHRFAPGSISVAVTDADAIPRSEVEARVKARLSQVLPADLQSAASKDTKAIFEAMDASPVAAARVDAALANLQDPGKETPEQVAKFLAALRALPPAFSWSMPSLVVEPSYTGALRAGIAFDYTPISKGYTVGAAATAGGGELVVQEDSATDGHASIVVGYSHYLVRRAQSSVGARFAITGGLSLVDYNGKDPQALSMAYLGPELSWPNFGIAVVGVGRRVESLRDGLQVGSALADNTQEADIIADGFRPGVAVLFYAPALINIGSTK